MVDLVRIEMQLPNGQWVSIGIGERYAGHGLSTEFYYQQSLHPQNVLRERVIKHGITI